jgi:DNA-binding response OmpR family regulator
MGKKILVIDDDASIRTLLTVNLSAEGYEVVTAAGGTEGLACLTRESFGLVILDITMPEKDGWEVCKAIRDNDSQQPQRIVMLTARDTPRDKMIGKTLLGADEYLTKPFEIENLLETVATYVKDC